MRIALVLLLTCACGQALQTTPDSSQPLPAVPFEPVARHGVYLVGQLEKSQIELASEVTYALADGYPKRIVIDDSSPAYVGNCALGTPGKLRWDEVLDLRGTSTEVKIVEGRLQVDVLKTGFSIVTLRGTFLQPTADGSGCTLDGVKPATLPVRHVLTISVRDVKGVRFHSPYGEFPVAGCGTRMVVPAGTPVSLPVGMLVDSDGGAFDAMNATTAGQLALELDAPAGFRKLPDGRFVLQPGEISVRSTAGLPATGVASMTVVSAAQLTAFDASFARHQWTKGDEWKPVQSGEAVDVSHGKKALKLLYRKASVGMDALCVPPPSSWYRFTGSTPAVCKEDVSTLEAAVLGDGTCRLRAELPGASFSWDLEITVSGSQAP